MRAKILGIVMAGGEGTRLQPLTRDRAKPAVPFGGKYRIIDFVLSNFINSEIYAIHVLVQFKSQSLIEHLQAGWRFGSLLDQYFISTVPAQMRTGQTWYQGTADAVYQNLHLIHNFKPDIVAVFGADHIYRMDIRQMVEFHLNHDAKVTIAALPVPVEDASAFGILQVDTKDQIIGFEEKPRQPQPMPQDPRHCLVSMGNYLRAPGQGP
jgi:glucose-1-phosphate adenylyltransferase